MPLRDKFPLLFENVVGTKESLVFLPIGPTHDTSCHLMEAIALCYSRELLCLTPC